MIVTFTTTFNTDTLPYDLSSMEEYKSDFTSRVGEIIDGAFPDETNLVVGIITSDLSLIHI